MTTGNSPPSSRWPWFIAGTLAAGLAACNSAPEIADAAMYRRLLGDGEVAPDAVVPTDAGDASPGDATVGDAPSSDAPSDGPVTPTLSVRAVADCGAVCTRPLDAVPNAMGTVVFFTAFTPTGQPAVFRAAVPAAGMPAAAPTVVAMGNGLEFPVGIALSNDDMTLYVADLSADRGTDEGVGAIFAIPAAGGMPTSVTLTGGLVQPGAVTVSFDGNDLLVSAQQNTDMGPVRGLYRVPRAGGMAAALSTALIDPSGASQGAMGNILCFDTRRGGGNSASVVTVGAMALADFATSLVVNHPAGVALALDSRSALLSGADPSGGGGMLTWVDSAGHATSPASLSTGMSSPGGLHRARMIDAWAVADESAGGNGQVFLVSAAH